MSIERIEQDARTLIEVSYLLDTAKEKKKELASFALGLVKDILEQLREG